MKGRGLVCQGVGPGLEGRGAAGQLLCPGLELAHAALEAAGPGLELANAAAQGAGALHGGLDPRHQAAHAGGQGACPIAELGGTVLELLSAVLELIHPVQQLLGAVYQLLGRIVQLTQGILQLLLGFAAVQIQLIQHPTGGQGHGHVQGEVRHIRRNGHGAGNLRGFNVLFVLVLFAVLGLRYFLQLQALGQAGQTIAQDNGVVAVIFHHAVVYLHVFHGVAAQQQAGGHQEGHIHGFGLAVYLHGLLLGVGVFNGNGELAAFARQLLGGDGFAVQGIGELYAHRQLLLALALIVHVLPAGGPGHTAAGAGQLRIPLDHGNVLQIGVVLENVLGSAVFQPVGDDHIAGGAVSPGDDIDRLILFQGRLVRSQYPKTHRRNEKGGGQQIAGKPNQLFFHNVTS